MYILLTRGRIVKYKYDAIMTFKTYTHIYDVLLCINVMLLYIYNRNHVKHYAMPIGVVLTKCLYNINSLNLD